MILIGRSKTEVHVSARAVCVQGVCTAGPEQGIKHLVLLSFTVGL